MKQKLLPLLLALSLLLTGCGWMDGRYSSVTPHLEQRQDTQPEVIVASDYLDLMDALEEMIQSGSESGVINVADYPSFDAAIEKIKELDRDDEKYLEMLSQPVLVDPTYPERLEQELGQFICHIFDQPIEQAYRRSRVYLPQRANDYLARAVDEDTLTMKNLMARMAEKIRKKVIR